MSIKSVREEIVANKRVELAIAQNQMSLDYLKELTGKKIAQDGSRTRTMITGARIKEWGGFRTAASPED